MKRTTIFPAVEAGLLRIAIGSAAAAGFLATPMTLHAEEADYLKVLEECADIQTGSERLACFDLTVSRLRETVEKRRTEEFGFSEYELAQRRDRAASAVGGIDPRNEEVEEYKASVVEFARNAFGKRLVILDNAQVWRETNPSTMRGSLQAGRAVTIEPSFGGAFRLSAEGKRGFLTVERVR